MLKLLKTQEELSGLESVNGELNDRLTSLQADNDLLKAQLTEACAALANVMFQYYY